MRSIFEREVGTGSLQPTSNSSAFCTFVFPFALEPLCLGRPTLCLPLRLPTLPRPTSSRCTTPHKQPTSSSLKHRSATRRTEAAQRLPLAWVRRHCLRRGWRRTCKPHYTLLRHRRLALGAGHRNPAFVSPTDNLMTPCTKKISAAKKKTFAK